MNVCSILKGVDFGKFRSLQTFCEPAPVITIHRAVPTVNLVFPRSTPWYSIPAYMGTECSSAIGLPLCLLRRDRVTSTPSYSMSIMHAIHHRRLELAESLDSLSFPGKYS